MDIFDYFHQHQHLPIHSLNNLDVQINNILIGLLLHDLRITGDHRYMFNRDNDANKLVRCMICLTQTCCYSYNFMICHMCILETIDIPIAISMAPFFYSIEKFCTSIKRIVNYSEIKNDSDHDKIFNKIIEENGGNYSKVCASIFNNIINNSHKLHKKYLVRNVTPIIFMLSLSDTNSLCHTLYMDIIIYILRFIY